MPSDGEESSVTLLSGYLRNARGRRTPDSHTAASAGPLMVGDMSVPDYRESNTATPWLVDLATVQRDTGPHPGRPIYDDERQMTYVREPAYEPAIDSSDSLSTKKADRETGEDQKGF